MMKNFKHNNTVKKIIKALKEKSAWTIICHENPDGDTLGSGLALYSLALRLNKKASIIGRDPLPETYRFYPMRMTINSVINPNFLKMSDNMCLILSNEARL